MGRAQEFLRDPAGLERQEGLSMLEQLAVNPMRLSTFSLAGSFKGYAVQVECTTAPTRDRHGTIVLNGNVLKAVL